MAYRYIIGWPSLSGAPDTLTISGSSGSLGAPDINLGEQSWGGSDMMKKYQSKPYVFVSW